MRRLVLGALVALAVPATASAMAPTLKHRHAYEHAYHQVVHRLGHRAPGRNIVRDGTPRGAATDRQVVKSITVLHRMLAPAPAAAPQGQIVEAGLSTQQAPVYLAAAPPALDSLAQCVEAHESGGNDRATNGQYHGVGQWSASAWAQDGGTRYGPDPLDATKAEQEAVLGSESDATLRQQQGQYDGCS